jgi:deazaflavin-dependent oxidoreductase (nitroreductase family)
VTVTFLEQKLTKKIPTWQSIFQRFLMTRLITAIVAPVLHHVDSLILRLSGGRLDITRASGLPIIELTTIGAKTGEPRTLPLAGYPDGDSFVLIASNYGRERHPAWYHNLKANPECTVKKDGLNGVFTARETNGEERDRYWDLASSYYEGYEVYKQRASHRKIPVMVLEPKPQMNTDKRR